MIRKIIRLVIAILAIWLFLYLNNQWLQTTEYTIQSERLPSAFNDLKIVQLSDLHDATFGDQQISLIKRVKQLDPDMVFITGDFVDSNRYDLDNSLEVAKQLVIFTDVFYVIGNHEVALNKMDEITEALTAVGVHVLRNETAFVERAGEKIAIVGVDDPLMAGGVTEKTAIGQFIDQAMENVNGDIYTLVLSHRPEVFSVYSQKHLDLIFTGHAHGGQVRIPGLGGLIAPGQGWFPTYTAGEHIENSTTMIVSRGLGNSLVPFRIFNRPEMVVATLKSKQ